MNERNCLTYIPPPMSILITNKDCQSSIEEYKERLEIIEKDLKWLLKLSYQKFWCQIIYDNSCQQLIDSYLKLSPRSHDSFNFDRLQSDVLKLHDSIHRCVFLICLRMSTYKESRVFKKVLFFL
jgi:hypothetical protein